MTPKERLAVLESYFNHGFFCDCEETRCSDDGWTEELVHDEDCDAVDGLIEILETM